MSSEAPQYKYVVQDVRRELWKAQLGDHRDPALSRKFLGNFKTRLQAAQAVADALGCPRRALKRAAPAQLGRKPKMTHRMIVPVANRGKWMWKTGARPGEQNMFADHVAALKHVCEATGLTEQQLLRKKVPKPLTTLRDRVRWLRISLRAARDADKGRAVMPADAQHWHRLATADKDPALRDPRAIVPMIMAKHGPWREAVSASFKACAKASSAPRRSYATALPALGSCDARARFMYHMLLETAHVMADIPPATMRPWYRGPGHLTSHHGFQVLLSASAGGERGSPPQGG